MKGRHIRSERAQVISLLYVRAEALGPEYLILKMSARDLVDVCCAVLSYLHLFHLGHDIGLFANTTCCPLCSATFSSEATQTMRAQHIYFACQASKTIWRASGLSNHPYPRIVIGTVSPASPNIDKFLFYVSQFLKTRRRVRLEVPRPEGSEDTPTLPTLSAAEIHRNLPFYTQLYEKQY